MNRVEERKNAIRDEFGIFESPQDLFEYIIDKSRQRPPLPADLKREEFLVKGCVSSLWLVPSFDKSSNLCHFRCDADSLITRGVATLLCDAYNGLTPEEILDFHPSFFEEIGITGHLSPNRRNGLSQLGARIESFARHAKGQNQA